jgi:uncharacterized membrane protein
MLWSFAIWGFAHILIYPTAKTFIVAAGIITRLQPQVWPVWERHTSYLPFVAILAGRARLGRFGLVAVLGGLVFWFAASWAHIPLSGWHAGVWRRL